MFGIFETKLNMPKKILAFPKDPKIFAKKKRPEEGTSLKCAACLKISTIKPKKY